MYFVIKWYRFCISQKCDIFDLSLSVHIDNNKKNILILGKRPTNVLDDITLTAEKEYSTTCKFPL